jgi:predicted RNA binding protein YcfA (HicA-like mRNA interferase family)
MSIIKYDFWVNSFSPGSHVRLTTFHGGTHNITIPLHDPIRIGTLSAILNDIAYHHKKSKQQIIEILF